MGPNMMAAHMKELVIIINTYYQEEGMDDSETKKWMFVTSS